MKKLIAVSILLVLLSTAAFAELEIGFSGSYGGDLLYFTKGSGTYEQTGSDKVEYGKGSTGSFHFLNSSKAWRPGNGLSLTFTHSGYYHEASIQLDAGGLLEKAATGDDSISWQTILDSGFGDWYFKGEAGMFDGYIGNTGYGGKVDAFGGFNDFFQLGYDEFGVNKAGDFQGADRIHALGDNALAFGLTFGDFKFAAGTVIDAHPDTANRAEPFGSLDGVNAAFIISGENVADLVTFDVFYAIQGGNPYNFMRPIFNEMDPNVYDPYNYAHWGNVLGLYAGLGFGDLGLAVGYTAAFDATETVGYNKAAATEDKRDTPIDFTHPIYSGIDLHFTFNGIENLGITWNNNISFVGAKGEEWKSAEDSSKIVVGLGGGMLGKDATDDFFSFHTALVGNYSLSDEVSLAAQLGNKMSQYTGVRKNGDTTITTTNMSNDFRFALNGEYTNGFVTFGAGLVMDIQGVNLKSESSGGGVSGTSTSDISVFTFGIPIYFNVSF